MQHQHLQHILCIDTHEGGIFFFKKGPKTHKIQDGGMFTWKFKMAAIFVKLYMSLPIYRCRSVKTYSFESIKNLQRFDFLKTFVIPGGGNAPPKKSNGGLFCHPSKSKWEVPRTAPTTWLNFYKPCKSQLQNAWPVSPTTRHGPFISD